MVRTQIQLTERQARSLREMAGRQQVSMAEVIRRAVDACIEADAAPDREALRRRALAAAGAFHDTDDNVASRHDAYLAEAFRA